jgi:hypothetical protein
MISGFCRALNISIIKNRMKPVILSVLLLLITYPVTGYAEEPLPPDGFIKITEDLLNMLSALEDDARNSNFNQLNNPVIQNKFYTVSASLKQYEDRSLGTVYSWPEGQQKKIASEMYRVNFLYRAYSLTQNDEFRLKAEKSLITVQELFHDYISHAMTGKTGYMDD